MKKLTLITILSTSLLLLQTGCARQPAPESVLEEPLKGADISQDGTFSSAHKQLTTSESADPDGNNNPSEAAGLLPRDLDSVSSCLTRYPNDFEELTAGDNYVIVHGRQYAGVELWESFYNNVRNGTPAELVLIQFTVEGDAILNYLNYDGIDFYLVNDYTRDAFAGDGKKYSEDIYPYLKVFDSTRENGDYERIILLTEDDGLSAREYLEKSGSETQTDFRTALVAEVFLGNEHAVLTGQEAWHDVGTSFDESSLLIPADRISKIEIQNGATGERLTMEEGDDFASIFGRYEALDIQPDDSLESRSGYAYLLRLYDADGNLLQSVIPYKDGVQIMGTLYDGSMNGTSTQLLQKLDALWTS